ncbi:MAG: hypothetical protein AB1659_08295, partial [Thermodesulfobacteriota bacterium]
MHPHQTRTGKPMKKLHQAADIPAATPAAEKPEGIRSAQEVLERFEKKRKFTGATSPAITLLAVLAAGYHLAYAYWHPFFALDHRSLHWAFMSTLLFTLYPFSKGRSPRNRISFFDGAFLAASAGISLWIFFNSTAIMNRAGAYYLQDICIGTALVVIVLEAARRSTGPAVPIIALIFIGYTLFGRYLPDALSHRGYSIERLSTYL